MDILGPLPNSKSGIQHVIDWTGRYKNMSRAIPVTTVASTNASTVFLDNCVILYEVTPYSLTEIGSQFVSKVFATVTVRLGVERLATTAHFHRCTTNPSASTERLWCVSDIMLQNIRPTKTSAYSLCLMLTRAIPSTDRIESILPFYCLIRHQVQERQT